MEEGYWATQLQRERVNIT